MEKAGEVFRSSIDWHLSFHGHVTETLKRARNVRATIYPSFLIYLLFLPRLVVSHIQLQQA